MLDDEKARKNKLEQESIEINDLEIARKLQEEYNVIYFE